MTDRPRLIEVAFPLKQASLVSVHEKNVRHGHISTLHIWPSLLLPGALPGLWAGEELAAGSLFAYFAGGHVVQVPRQGYEEPVLIPKAERAVVEKAVGDAVQAGQLWLLAGQASLCAEAVPSGVLADDA